MFQAATINRVLEITHLAVLGRLFVTLFYYINPSQITMGWSVLRQMSLLDAFLTLFGILVGFFICLGRAGIYVIMLIWHIMIALSSDSHGSKLASIKKSSRIPFNWSLDKLLLHAKRSKSVEKVSFV